MQTVRRLFRPAAWLALVAILALALAPTVSHALAASGTDNPWSEICTDVGGRTLVVADSKAPDGAAAHLGHCPLCSVSAQALPVPSSEVAGVWAPAGRDAAATLARVPPARALPWPPAQPGAPPASA